MKKTTLFIFSFLVLCFYGNAFASLSDQEKINIIRGVAVPSPKQTFYKWVSKTDKNAILIDGEITPEIYEYFMRFKGHFSLAGPGIYVNTNPKNGFLEGEVLIQVEAQEGYRYLDLSDKEILNFLEEEGITLEDVHRLNSNVALISYETLRDAFHRKVVFKGARGIKITSFTGKGWVLSDLGDLVLDISYYSEEHGESLLDPIKEDIQKRAERYIALLDCFVRSSKKDTRRTNEQRAF